VDQGFTVNQADSKGGFATSADLESLAAANGVIKLTLADISAVDGDQNHVTASAVSAACQLS